MKKAARAPAPHALRPCDGLLCGEAPAYRVSIRSGPRDALYCGACARLAEDEGVLLSAVALPPHTVHARS